VNARRRLAALSLSAAMALSWAAPRVVCAQEAPAAGYDVSLAADGAITGGLLAGTLLITLVPVDTSKRWSSEIFGRLDESVRKNFSDSGDLLSDSLIAVTMAVPALLALPGGWNRDTAQQLLLHGEAISANLLMHGITKYLVQRPRPYNYHRDPRVAEYARRAGEDSHLSFYSGHASTGFAAAVAGSYVFASGSADREIKAMIWLLEMTLASTTAQLRIRAGRHFYSDVLIGALVGGAIGFAVPALHADAGGLYAPSGLEWMALAGGVILGTAAGQLLPLANDVSVPLSAGSVRLVPTVDERASGVALAGWF
jgi:membrane-associated phospholipid phosphatase